MAKKFYTEAELAKREELVRTAHKGLLSTHGPGVARCSLSFECWRCGASGAVTDFGRHGVVLTGDINKRCGEVLP